MSCTVNSVRILTCSDVHCDQAMALGQDVVLRRHAARLPCAAAEVVLFDFWMLGTSLHEESLLV